MCSAMFIQHKPMPGRPGSTWVCPLNACFLSVWVAYVCVSEFFTYRCLVGMFLIWWISKVVRFYKTVCFCFFREACYLCVSRGCLLYSTLIYGIMQFHSETWFWRVLLWFWTFSFLTLLHHFSAVMDAELHILNSVSALVSFRLCSFFIVALAWGFSPNRKFYFSAMQTHIETHDASFRYKFSCLTHFRWNAWFECGEHISWDTSSGCSSVLHHKLTC